MSLLDTVEPDWWDEQGAGPFYSRETVESLLSQCRKEALLEAADQCAFFQNEQERGRLQSKNMARMCELELRRMAESDKTTMEGEN